VNATVSNTGPEEVAMEPQPAPASSRQKGAETPTGPPPDPAVDVALQLVGCPREAAVQALLESVEWQREPLERARDALIRRLDRRSDDFEASKALRLVYAALARVGWPGYPAGSRMPHAGSHGGGHRRTNGLLHRLGSVFRR
jgi:hypothetical protein